MPATHPNAAYALVPRALTLAPVALDEICEFEPNRFSKELN